MNQLLWFGQWISIESVWNESLNWHDAQNCSSLLDSDSILLQSDVFTAVVDVDAAVFGAQPHGGLA